MNAKNFRRIARLALAVEAKQLEGATATLKLLSEPHFDPLPTVTDRMTELLAAEPKSGRR